METKKTESFKNAKTAVIMEAPPISCKAFIEKTEQQKWFKIIQRRSDLKTETFENKDTGNAL